MKNKLFIVAGLFLVCEMLSAQGGEYLPLAVQKSTGSVVHILDQNPHSTDDGQLGFFISQDTLITSIDLVKKEDIIQNPKSLALYDHEGQLLSSVRVVGYRGFSEVLGLAVLTVKGYLGPVLSLSHLSGIQTRGTEVYLSVINVASGMGEVLRGQVQFSDADYQIYDGALKNFLPASPILSSQGDVLAVSLKQDGGKILVVPVSFVKDLLSTDFQWKNLNYIKEVPQRIKQKDNELIKKYDMLEQQNPGKGYFNRLLRYIKDREIGLGNEKDIKMYGSPLITGIDDGSGLDGERMEESDFLSDFLEKEASQSVVNLFRHATYLEGGDIKRALALYEQAAKQGGHTPSQARLGWLYYSRALRMSNLEENDSSAKLKKEYIKEAEQWLKKAALKGHGDSQLLLALLLNRYTKDTDRTKYWLEKAALNHSFQAQYELILIFLSEAGKTDSEEERLFWKDGAWKWITQAGGRGYPPALFIMVYFSWINNIMSDLNKTKKALPALVSRVIAYPSFLRDYNFFWEQSSAWRKNGKNSGLSLLKQLVSFSNFHEDGKSVMFFMGQVFEHGFFSIPRSLKEARTYYRKAALENHGEAAYRLAESYRISQTKWSHPEEEIIKWYRIAEKTGFARKPVAQAIKSIENSKRRLEDWIPKNGASLPGLTGALLCMPLFF